MKSAVIAVRKASDRDLILECLDREIEITDEVSDAVELLAACIGKRTDLLIVDAALPALHDMKEVRWLRENGHVSCIIVLDSADKSRIQPEDMNVIDGVLVQPIARQNILPCYMMSIACSSRTDELRKETEEIRKRLAYSRAMEYLRYSVTGEPGNTGLQPEDYITRLKKRFPDTAGKAPEELALLYYSISNSPANNDSGENACPKRKKR